MERKDKRKGEYNRNKNLLLRIFTEILLHPYDRTPDTLFSPAHPPSPIPVITGSTFYSIHTSPSCSTLSRPGEHNR